MNKSDLRRLTKKILNEQNFAFECDASTCQCTPTTGIGQGTATYLTMADCMADYHNCCSTGSGGSQWWCMTGVAGPGNCVQSPTNPQPGMASGPYPTQNMCMSYCTQGLMWDCNNGNCIQSSTGQFVTLADCQGACSGSLTWKCKGNPKFGKQCVQVQPGYGDFATKQDCQASKQCAQLKHTGKHSGVSGSVKKEMPNFGNSDDDMERSRERARALNEAALSIINEGPICGDKTGDACGNCGDGYVWTDSHVTNSCICNHSNGAVCHSTGSYIYSDGDVKGVLQNRGDGDKATDSVRLDKNSNNKKMKRTVTIKEGDLINKIEKAILSRKVINENKVCRCMGQTHYGHNGPIMCNTAQYGVQAWWASDCCQKTMETPEGCWVSSNIGGSGNGGPTKDGGKMIGGGSGFVDKLGGSERLAKFNSRQTRKNDR
jgi:hypothetical protein